MCWKEAFLMASVFLYSGLTLTQSPSTFRREERKIKSLISLNSFNDFGDYKRKNEENSNKFEFWLPWKRSQAKKSTDSIINRIPGDINTIKCVCGSSLTYSTCCHRLHSGYDEALQPTELLRARFSAFAYRLPLFIIKTTSRDGNEWKNDQSAWETEILEFCDMYRFLGIDIGTERKAGVNVAYLTFTVSLELRQRPVRGQVTQIDFSERSRFVKLGARWLYDGGSLLEFTEFKRSTRDKSNLNF